jgi:hypothetical protein
MRKFSMLALAGAATLAVALPASAQPGVYDRGYDNRGYDSRFDGRNGYDRSGGARQLLSQIERLRNMVERDMYSGRMSKSQAKKYFRRLDGDRDRLIRDRRDRYDRYDNVEREVARDLADIERAYREFQRNQRYDRRW